MSKVTVVGAGNVGATVANCVAQKDIVNEVVLLDIKEGVSEARLSTCGRLLLSITMEQESQV